MKHRHEHLLKNPDVRRRYENLSRGSIITAEERLRRLERFDQVAVARPSASNRGSALSWIVCSNSLEPPNRRC